MKYAPFCTPPPPRVKQRLIRFYINDKYRPIQLTTRLQYVCTDILIWNYTHKILVACTPTW